VLASRPLGEAGVVDAPLPPPLRVTPYSRTGDLPVLLMLFVLTAVLLRVARRGAGPVSH
jgi:apolipoprotein N-acyltransferase